MYITACIIYISLSVTVVTAEKSFATLTLIVNCSRNSVGRHRHSNIAISNIDIDVAKCKLDLEKIRFLVLESAKPEKKKLSQMKTNVK